MSFKENIYMTPVKWKNKQKKPTINVWESSKPRTLYNNQFTMLCGYLKSFKG